MPGDPKFTGTLSPDGKAISGDYSQGGGTMPFTLAWKREATREVIPASTPITKEFEGTWEGALDVGGKTLRLVLTLTNADGRGVASIVSVDQGGAQIPAASVQQNASHLSARCPGDRGLIRGRPEGRPDRRHLEAGAQQPSAGVQALGRAAEVARRDGRVDRRPQTARILGGK